jgi:N-terminal acetyltransferase B complex non-catalytic subunit
LENRILENITPSTSRLNAAVVVSSRPFQTQRELKPGDDLILLAVQQLLYEAKMSEHTSSNPLFVSTILLESALRHSPDNAYLKFLAIEVYRQMDAAARSWEYFQMICLKHIQLDTCTFTVLPYLLEGGLYNEIIEVCSALLRFHGATARDCGDYASRAMEAGTLSKADEFMEFQRLKMNQSLTLQYSKGLILDSAPLLATAVPSIKNDENPFLKGGLGITQGIVGGKEDMERAIQMVVESHNPYASLSIVSWANHCGSLANVDVLSDNRDLSILTQFSTLVMPVTQTKEAMVQETLLRGHVHGLLIRATVCLDAMRGPKKGKVVKSSPALERRTQSLLSCVLTASEMVDHQMVIRNDTVRASQKLLRAFLDLCRLLAVINAGMPRMDEDSMEQRENRAADMLSNHAIITLKQAREELVASTSIKIVCALLPSSIVPMFAVFRMCSDVCTAYGWGKRKLKTKKVAGALAEYAREFNLLLQDMINCVKKLPKSDSEPTMNFDLSEKERSVLDESDVRLTAAILTVAQHRTRIRIEPILQEMDEYLEEFDVTPDE